MTSRFRIPAKGRIVFLHDIVMAAVSFVLSLYLRLGDDLFFYFSPELLVQGTLLFTAVCAGVFWFMGLYRGVWRYASLNDLIGITRSASLAVLVFFLVMFLWTRLEDMPRSVLIINWFVLMALLGAPRFLFRMFKDRHVRFGAEETTRRLVPVLLAGADDGAELFIRSQARAADATYRVVGILSERRARVGRRIHGVEVLGTTDDIVGVVDRLAKAGDRPQRLILTKDHMDGALVRRLLDAADGLGMTLARLPKLTDFKGGVADKLEVHPVAVEDLLGRPQSALDRDAMRVLIEGRRVLVTGAGGSIGAELARQIAERGPDALVLVDHSEYNLYAIDMELARRRPGVARRSLIADVRDRDRIQRLFAEHRPELVFHAAALKHVPLVEANPLEGVMTNVIGTVNVADACAKADAAAMVLISTDKAVNPVSVMGATKRIAETYCQALDIEHAPGGGPRFITVRFGNVLGSTGSVVPLFQKQLAEGGPLTVTHAEMTRYFMTTREAVELVLEASALGCREASAEGRIFVLDMGEPVKILDLARQMIRLAGLRPDKDIRIEFVGLRPGEKLAEDMFHTSERLMPTEHPGLLLAAPRTADRAELARRLAALREASVGADRARVMEILHALVPEYRAWGGEARKVATA